MANAIRGPSVKEPAGATPAAGTAITRRAVEAISALTGEPAWMREQRLAAWGLYESLPLPGPTVEEWRRTDISGLRLDALRTLADGAGPAGASAAGGFAAASSPPQASNILAAEGRAGLLVQRDGRTVQHSLDEALRQQGVLFLDLDHAAQQAPDLVREHFLSVVRPDEVKFRALHTALRAGGTFLYVPPRVEVALPLITTTWLDTPGAVLSPHTLLVAGEGSNVTFIDLYGSEALDRQTVASGAAELILLDGAQVRYVAFQAWGGNVWDFSMVRAHLGRDAGLHSLIVGFGGTLVKTDVESKLRGPGAHSEMLGLYFADDTQHFDYHTLQEHLAPHTLSDLLYKGSVKDRARTVFSGLIRVHPGAQKTNAFQSNRNLILNSGAKSDSIPKLEIMANDLRCTHGSATSRLNDEHLFYLMSRGLTRRQAVQMVVDGFFAEVLDRVPLAGFDWYLRKEIGRKIAEM